MWAAVFLSSLGHLRKILLRRKNQEGWIRLISYKLAWYWRLPCRASPSISLGIGRSLMPEATHRVRVERLSYIFNSTSHRSSYVEIQNAPASN